MFEAEGGSFDFLRGGGTGKLVVVLSIDGPSHRRVRLVVDIAPRVISGE